MSVEQDMAAYYAKRAAYYERVYFKPERQVDLRAMEAWLSRPFEGREVLELACGTAGGRRMAPPVPATGWPPT